MRLGAPARLMLAAILLWCSAWPALAGQAGSSAGTNDEAAQSPDGKLQVDQINAQAIALFQAGHLAQAEPLFAQAEQLARRVLGERSPDRLTILGNHAVLLYKMGNAAEAEPKFAKALQLSREVLGQRDPATLEILGNHAAALEQLGRAKQAQPEFAEVLEFRREVLGERHPATINSLNSYAAVLQKLGRTAEAEPRFAEALKLSREVMGERHLTTISALNNYALVLNSLGRSVDAEPLFAQVLQALRDSLGERHPTTIASMSNYAGVLDSLDRIGEAEPLYAEALRLKSEVLGERHPSTIASMINYAFVLNRLDRTSEAESLIAKTWALARDVLGENHPTTLIARNMQAFALEGLGRASEAEPLFAQVLAGRRQVQGERHPETLTSINNYAHVIETLGRVEEAMQLYAQALRLRRDVLGANHPDTLSSAGNLAYASLNSRSPEQGFEPARLAADGWRQRRDSLGDDPRSQSQLERDQQNQAQYFKLLADASWSAQPAGGKGGLAYRTEAFAALQDVLAGSASRAIAQSAARRAAQRTGGLGALARERQQLSDAWLASEKELTSILADSDTEAADKRANLREQLAGFETRMAAIDKELRMQAPDYFALVRPEAISIEQARKLLRPDEAALMLVPTGLGTHVMLVTRDGLAWQRSEWSASQIDAAVRRLLWDVGADVTVSVKETLAWEREGEGAYPFDFATAHALYQQLIAPVAEGLAGKTHLFVMASGSLSSLPLGILVSEVPEGPNGSTEVLRSAKWLADQFALVQAPSLQSIHFLREFRGGKDRGGSGAAKSFLGFGDPVLEGKAQLRGSRSRTIAQSPGARSFARLFDGRITRGGGGIANIGELRRMARLPGTADELQAMWQAFGKPDRALYLEQAATEPAVKSATLDAGVIVFATHGLLAGEIRGVAEPGLVLTPPEQASETDDGYLSMSDVAGLTINADWVILSACNSAGGDGSEGATGLSGLARAFFYAGARNLLASDWPVRDDVSARLTVRTVELARNNPELSRAQAFQQAMREIRNDPRADSDIDTWAHPNAWAPFVIVGDR